MSEKLAFDYNNVSPDKNPKDFIIESLQNEAKLDAERIRDLEEQNNAGQTLIELLLRDRLNGGKINEENLKQLESLKEQATTDVLTKVKNRLGLKTEVYAKRISLEKKNPERDSDGVLLVLDIDFFKKINDTYGHATGDEALVAFANKLKKVFGNDSVIARYGGEEFVIYIPGKKLDEIQNQLSEGNDEDAKLGVIFESSEGKEIRFTVSGGIMELPKGKELNEAINTLDSKLYLAKQTGRNRILKV